MMNMSEKSTRIVKMMDQPAGSVELENEIFFISDCLYVIIQL